MQHWKPAFTLFVGGALALAGCGGGSGAASSGDIGHAGDAASASRTVEVRQLDALRFEPSSVEVKPGETVTFRITNTGTLIHQFSLGDSKAQVARDGEMKAMGSAPMSMSDTGNERTVQPGASEEITWTFPQKGAVDFGCHEPGHYGKGMKGKVTVQV